jgi:tRNA(fMet)-specific endonuclease VapC
VKRYLLDTDISSYVIRSRPERVRERFRRLDAGQLAVSAITEAELLYGVRRAGARAGVRADVEDFLRRLEVLDWNHEAASHYADIRAHLEKTGKPIGNMDLLIAAHARYLGAVLVTNNERHFRRVPHLTVENWA